MPNSATEKLAKILKLEAERGYQDKAVTRGLASFATAWLSDASRSNIDAAWAASIADEMRAYSAANDLTTRRAALSALINRLHSPTLNTSTSAPTSAPRTSSSAPSFTPRDAGAPAPRPEKKGPTGPAPQFAERNTPRNAASKRARPTQRESAVAADAPIDVPAPIPDIPRVADRETAGRETADRESEPQPVAEKPQAKPQTQTPVATPASERIPVHVTPAPSSATAKSARPVTRATSQRQMEQLQPRRGTHAEPARDAAVGLDAPVSNIAGIGSYNAQRMAKLGVYTIRDLLYYFPTRYDDYSSLKTINQLEYGESVTIIGRIASAWKHRTKTGMYLIRVAVEDSSGMIECTWFTSERMVEYMMRNFQVDREIVISGKVTEYLGKLIFQNPSYEPAEKEWVVGGSIVPVYRLTEGLQPLLMRRTMKRVIDYWPAKVPEFLPEHVRQSVKLYSLSEALREIHWPRDLDSQEQARKRLAFDELFILQMAVLKQRQVWQREMAQPLAFEDALLERLKSSLPYTLTGAQDKASAEISADLHKPNAMHRLLQGDVGSGKTVVAALAMALTASVGAQSALMAPTEILAEQHATNLQKLFDSLAEKGVIAPIQLRLLTGSVKAADKRDIYTGLSDGSIQVVIGTHALIQDGVSFKNLGLAVVDEQHRFGVEQRKALRAKAGDYSPHTLVMTATPIPRTLALTLYGDLDNTVLDEMPPGRQPIETHWFAPAERERAYSFVRQQIEQGRQAFIICPLVEESEKIEAKAAVEEHARLQREVFPHQKLGLLHGRLKADEKEEVMGAFARGELEILVSTSVVEVGIDVPNATVMMIEGANRFGLSQLHQFRGRVGRGQYKSYCLLIADTSSAMSDERLFAIVTTQDGFKLAEKDLEIRGPGEFFGTRQSGEPALKLLNMRDRDLLLVAREQAEKVLNEMSQAELAEQPEYALLTSKINAFWSANEHHGDAS